VRPLCALAKIERHETTTILIGAVITEHPQPIDRVVNFDCIAVKSIYYHTAME